VQGTLRPGFDQLQQSISALGLGPGSVVQSANFMMFGTALLLSVGPWARILAGGPGARAVPAFTALAALALIAAAFVPQDPAPGYDPEAKGEELPTLTGLIHLAIAAVCAIGSIGSLFALAGRFRVAPGWHAWVWPTRWTAVGAICCIAIYAVWSTQATGLAGLFERMAILLPGAWLAAVVSRLE
jgi:hypothetical protein